MDEGIIVDNDDDSEHQRNLTISPGPVDDPTTETTSFSGSCGDLSVFRDFFLAAFSDGYSNVSCLRQQQA